jgi:hypothetical protein
MQTSHYGNNLWHLEQGNKSILPGATAFPCSSPPYLGNMVLPNSVLMARTAKKA